MPDLHGPVPEPPPGIRLREARLKACREAGTDFSEWEVEVDGQTARAVAFPSLTGPLRSGDRVLLNTTAVALSLGTGGVHFVVASCEAAAIQDSDPFPGRTAGHILKLRYTPLQTRVLTAEEEASPHREAVAACPGLEGMPVLGAELLSQAAAAAIAARAAAPGLRIALLVLDTAALPLAFSRLARRLREDGVLSATVTAGQAFGGDFEAVNVYSGLLVARAAAGADLVVVTQGPGNAGTGTEYGFSGLGVVEALHAAATLGGLPILAARFSEADPRPRHRGLSHHTKTILRCLRAEALIPVPPEAGPLRPTLETRLNHLWVETDPEPVVPALEPYREVLTTMGRTLEQDPLFFRAAAAAGWEAARRAPTVGSTTTAGGEEAT